MYLSTEMFALIVVGTFVLGVITSIIFISRTMAKRNKLNQNTEEYQVPPSSKRLSPKERKEHF